LVRKTLDALRATGDEPIPLNPVWRVAVQMRDGYQNAVVLSLRTLLTFGRIRPVMRNVAKTLLAVTHNEALHKIIEARAEDQWELWDMLNLLAEGGFNPKSLWKSHPGEREHVTRLVPPETFRTYSISSVMQDDTANEIHLTIGGLHYQTRETPVSRSETRTGTGSSFLGRMINSVDSETRRISMKIIHPPRFSLPGDPAVPVVMFAGGTGIAPFRSMLQARAGQEHVGENWLFFGTRSRAELYYQSELEALVAANRLSLVAAFSQEDIALTTENGQVLFQERQRCYINEVMLTPAMEDSLWKLIQQGAFFYVCGRTGFAKSVMEAVQKIIINRLGESKGREFFYRLMGEDRYMQEVFTTYGGPQFDQDCLYSASEVVLHNNPGDGYWFIVNGRVYDVSEFAHLHAGGLKIIQSYAGMDATIAYKKVQHDINPEVDSLLGMYQIGAVQRLNFGPGGGIAVTPRGLRFVSIAELYGVWVRFLYAVVEMENALLNDYSIRGEQLTHDENRGHPRSSPYRSQMLLQTHERFLRDYLSKICGDPLNELWALTSGLCSEQRDYRWMHNQTLAIETDPLAHDVRNLGRQALQQLSTISDDQLVVIQQFTDHVCEADRNFLEQMKLGLRRGVQVFERFESHTISLGNLDLLSATQALPQALSAYYQSLSRLKSMLFRV
jgi:cytochrome b involved in lipid metabolism